MFENLLFTVTLQCFGNYSSVAKNKEKIRADLLTKTNGKFIYRYFGSRFPGKIPSLGFDYRENRKVHLNLKGNFSYLVSPSNYQSRRIYLVKRLTSLYPQVYRLI